MRFLRSLLIGITGLLLLTAAAIGQAARIEGTIRDAKSGESLPGANVVVISPETRDLITGVATAIDGTYQIEPIAPGEYLLKVEFIGYIEAWKRVNVQPLDRIIMDFDLEVALFDINSIIVTASRQAEKVLDAPASVTVLTGDEIAREVTPSAVDLLRNVTSVDVATVSMTRAEVVLRGFNTPLDRSTYTLFDYRPHSVPAIGTNILTSIPNATNDISRIEVVRGPGSALYGPGVDAGVIHFITKDPMENPGTTISFGGGERGTSQVGFRHAGVLPNKKVGYKISGNYFRGDDWELNPQDSVNIQVVSSESRPRVNESELIAVNSTLRLRVTPRTWITVNGGISQLSANTMTGIGAFRNEKYRIGFGQMRLQSGGFFAQSYINFVDANESYDYTTGEKLLDKSTEIGFQSQYDISLPAQRGTLILGVDFTQTNPKTEGSVHGRNENDDQITEAGGYAQLTTDLVPARLYMVLATRGDYNNIAEDFEISPRVGLVFKPGTKHTFRGFYNRSFSSPNATNYFLDRVAFSAGPLTFRGLGNANGYTWQRNPLFAAFAGTDIVAASLNPANFGQAMPVGLPIADVYASVYNSLQAQVNAGQPLPGLDLAASQLLVSLLNPTQLAANTAVGGFSKGALAILNPVTEGLTPVEVLEDVPAIQPTITQTYEIGYKGLLGERLLFTGDVYFERKENFIGPVEIRSPFVFVPTLAGDLQTAMATSFADSPNLVALLSNAGLTPEQLAALIAQVASQNPAFPSPETPIALVQPVENTVPGEVLLTYRNFGKVNYWGFDLNLEVLVSDNLTFFANYAWINDDYFDDDELNVPGSGRSLSLNSAKQKIKAGAAFNIPGGFAFNIAVRYNNGYPFESGTLVGAVDAYTVVDFGIGYDLRSITNGMRVDVMASNIFDKKYRVFIGAPEIGRMVMARVQFNF